MPFGAVALATLSPFFTKRLETATFGVEAFGARQYLVEAGLQMFADHPNFIHSFSPAALPTDSLAAPDLISDIVVWLASDASSLVTAAQIPAEKGYLKI